MSAARQNVGSGGWHTGRQAASGHDLPYRGGGVKA